MTVTDISNLASWRSVNHAALADGHWSMQWNASQNMWLRLRQPKIMRSGLSLDVLQQNARNRGDTSGRKSIGSATMERSCCFPFPAFFSARAQNVSPSVWPKLKSPDRWKVDQNKTRLELLTCVPVWACLWIINCSSDSHNGKNLEMSRMINAHQGKLMMRNTPHPLVNWQWLSLSSCYCYFSVTIASFSSSGSHRSHQQSLEVAFTLCLSEEVRYFLKYG